MKHAKKDLLPKRYAEAMFWLGRYLERAESLANLLDVTYSFSPASQNAQNWQSMLAIYMDEENYAEQYGKITQENVISFYLCNDKHASSIFSCLSAARYNASQLRPLISNEMWVQINTAYNQIKTIATTTPEPKDLWHILSAIRCACQMLTGIAESGLYRDQSLYFYLAGKNIERADQMTRLLDIKYHLLLPSSSFVGSTLDSSQWFALLRAGGGYHVFRREHQEVISPASAAGFLLLNRQFPRSVLASLKTLGFALGKLHKNTHLANIAYITEINDELIAKLDNDAIAVVIKHGLHEYLDNIQLCLMDISAFIRKEFFR